MRRRLPLLKTALPYALLVLAIISAVAWAQPSASIQTPNASGDPAGLTAASGPGVGEVTLTWTQAANASAHWVWSVQPDGQDSRWHRADAAGSAVIRDLEPGQEYWFIVIAVQSGPAVGPPSWSGFSDWVKGVALAAPPPPELDAAGGLTAAPGPNPGEVSLRWTPGAGADVHWVWSVRADGTDSRWHQAYDNDGSIAIDGLEIGVEYAFAVISAYVQPDGRPLRWSNFSNWVTALPQPAPPPSVTVAGAANRIAAGGKHTCMLQKNGAAVCWGANGDADKGQADPPDGVVFTAITAGYEHTCGIIDAGNARCWGDNSSGQSTAPSGTFTAIDAGRAHTCALNGDGIAQCWGSNEYGQLDAPAGASFTAITAGGEHSCGLHEDGRVECWGDNHYQQSTVLDALFYAVSAGTWHSCGIKRDGSIACWGANPDGQAPAEVGGSYQAVSAGGKHTCAIATDGGSYCWGNNNRYVHEYRVIAINSGGEHTCWLKEDNVVECSGSNRWGQSALPSSDTFTSVSASWWSHTCGVRTDSTVVCWGNDSDGKATPPEGSFRSVGAGESHTCGLRIDSTVVCWGSNFGERAFPPRGLFQSIDVGDRHTCGVRTDGSIAQIHR